MVDCGKIINKLVVDGQVYGALAQGIGLALTENLEKHTTLVKCGIPQIEDIPDDLEIYYEEAERPDGPYGASGVGEGPLAAPHPAILNAIFNATGARITKVPATPDVVKEALEGLEIGANA
ncbi:molybdopterin cofactor-binding domain-containing protein [Terrisporobacter mayombei]|uniref:Aldehyde oxidoreductase n=2 Tax=Terrisporobacter mayombei TaxID=1541 RepID=A0ABY9Q6H2_9FIRM|nr:Aldehyde oxidoreductase [Terrisporobacter mayombei]